MNHLNSFLGEGIVTGENAILENGILFCIKSERFNKETAETEIVLINVEVSGKLAELCKVNAISGKVIRVCGRLKMHESSIRVYAEHAEFRGGVK